MIDFAGDFPDNAKSLIREMIRVAKQAKDDVGATFDGVQIVVAPDTELNEALKAFREARRNLVATSKQNR